MDIDHSVVDQRVATGQLPRAHNVAQLVQDSYDHALRKRGGAVAGYIPELANANPESLAVVAAQVDGVVHAVGDAAIEFSIQSISKAFVYALACHTLGHGVVRDTVGVNNVGRPFNSVMAIELNDGHPMNSMVNAGAIATTAIIPGETEASRWNHIRSGLSAFAGRDLRVDDAAYRSEPATNQHN